MNPPTNNWRSRQTEHCLYLEIVTDITRRNPEHKDTQLGNDKKNDKTMSFLYVNHITDCLITELGIDNSLGNTHRTYTGKILTKEES
jgi:hypothetical protein